MSFANLLHLACILFVLGTVFTYIIMSDLLFTQLSPRPMERQTSSTGSKMSPYVLILAQPRTGSSFLGQLFNQHPDVFYLYEPLHPFAMFKKLKYVTERNYATLTRAFLRNVSICNFTGFQEYFSFLSHPGLSSPHFLLSSRSLASPPLCKYEVQPFENQSEFLRKCPLLDANSVSLVCASKRFVAAKVLTHRLPELENLRDFIEDAHFHSRKIPLKIIQLVRDPRAVVWSMIKMGLTTRGIKNYTTRTEINKQEHNATFRLLRSNFIKQVKLVCDRLNKDVNFSLYLSSKLGVDRYRVIRYEEFAENTLEFAYKIFQFSGIDFAAEVKEWLRNSTFNKKKQVTNELSYSTSNKNTTLTINSWRKELSLLETSLIDKQCANFIRNFSYKFVESVDHLTDISISLLYPFRKNFHTL